MIHLADKSDDLYIKDFWRKGYSSLIAEVLKTSRQNVDKHIRSGRIKESRNMDGTLMLWIEKRREKMPINLIIILIMQFIGDFYLQFN